MSDRNTTMIPCQDCELEENAYLVEAHVPDDVLNEYNVESADELSKEDLASLYSEGRISAPTCSYCGSGNVGEENQQYDVEKLLELGEQNMD